MHAAAAGPCRTMKSQQQAPHRSAEQSSTSAALAIVGYSASQFQAEGGFQVGCALLSVASILVHAQGEVEWKRVTVPNCCCSRPKWNQRSSVDVLVRSDLLVPRRNRAVTQTHTLTFRRVSA